jgi:phosphatidylinositol-3-phosphatase
MRALATTVVSLAALAVLTSGCGSGSSPDAGPPSPADRPPIGVGTGAVTSSASKVLVVIEENHTLEEMRQGMPFLSELSHRYGYATHWSAITHPSEPNYLAIVGGSTFGIRDDGPPWDHADDVGDAPSVFDQALAAGRTATTYAESMPDNCDPNQEAQDPAYAVRHNPWVFFSAGRAACLAHDVSLEPFAGDAARNALPDVGLLVPNLDHDAHDGSLATADTWLEDQLTSVLRSSDFTSGRLVVIVTADEDDRSGDNRVLTSVLTPALSHEVVDVPLTHYSLTRFIAQVIGVEPLGEGARAPDLATAFGL